MSDMLGEWGVESSPEAVSAAAGGAVSGSQLASLTHSLLDEMLVEEVRSQVRKRLVPYVSEALEGVFTPDVLEDVRTKAAQAAAAELAFPHNEPAAAATEDAPPLYYGSVEEFVREMIVPVFMRKIDPRGTRRWAAEWWRSPEAIMRLEALWRSWEHLRLDPATGISVWLRDHADHHLAVLMDAEGPWRRSGDMSEADEPLPYAPPPAELFPDVRALSGEEEWPPLDDRQ